MRPKVRKILEDCIHSGLRLGNIRAYKHSDKPDEEYILQTIEDAIWLEIDETFDFELPAEFNYAKEKE